MIEIVWEFVVKEEAQGQFELVYGPGGAWSNLFAAALGFRGTTVMRDMKNLHRYLVIDLWDAEAQRNIALVERETEYSELQSTLDKWIESKTKLGTFNVLPQGTVRPRGKTGRSKTKGDRLS